MDQIIYTKNSGFHRVAAVDDNAVSKQLYDFFDVYSKGLKSAGGKSWNRAHWDDVEMVKITSTNRPRDPEGSPHRLGVACDIVVRPANLMPFFWAVLDQYFPLNFYLAVPRSSSDFQRHVGWGLHIHVDAKNNDNKLRIERVDGSLDDPITHVSEISKWYYDDGAFKVIGNCPLYYQELKWLIANRRGVNDKLPLDRSFYEDSILGPAATALTNAAETAENAVGRGGNMLGNLIGIALVVGGVYLGYKLITSGELKTAKKPTRRSPRAKKPQRSRRGRK